MAEYSKQKELPSTIEIKQAIPRHCFESTVVESMYYAIRSLMLSTALVLALQFAQSMPHVSPTSYILHKMIVLAYVIAQGVTFWGIFTVAHDCAHGAFSRYAAVNDLMGLILDTIVLTPYEAWKVSHRLHHKNTGNIDKDIVYFPHRKLSNHDHSRSMIATLGFAWIIYLLYGYPPNQFNHFNPWEPKLARQILRVSISFGVQVSIFVLILAVSDMIGWRIMFLYYYGPLFVFASLLVVTTFLNHTDDDVPWYIDSEWSPVKGNLSSVDRSYGRLMDNLTHHIGYHQVHHLLPMIPHYHLVEATHHFRAAFPEFARQSQEPILKAFIRLFRLFAVSGVVDHRVQVFTLRGFVPTQETCKCE